MGKPIGKHKDRSDCYTRNCSLEHPSVQGQIVSLQNQINKAFDKPAGKEGSRTFRSLEYGSPEYNFFISKAEEAEANITSAEYKTVMEYTGWAYKHYYSYLEGVNSDGSVFGSDLDDGLKTQLTNVLTSGVKNLDNFIAKTGKFPKPVKVFRGEKPPAGVSVATHLAKTYPVGGSVEIKRYLSTTMDAKIASEITGDDDGYVLVIEANEGAMLGENISEQGLREKEVLLPRGKRYEVTRVSNDVIQVGSSRKNHVTVYLKMK